MKWSKGYFALALSLQVWYTIAAGNQPKEETVKFEDITLRDISWIIGCIDGGMDDGLIESLNQYDLGMLETIIDTVATPQEKGSFCYDSYKESIARWRDELSEWEAEKATWED